MYANLNELAGNPVVTFWIGWAMGIGTGYWVWGLRRASNRKR